uniref:Uncharacterized protein n=1 Tax=Myoviridae sp. ctkfK18 TaxID=2825165 RepID=A0A8S5VH71_9CAUD|nr:MAG TPA: hypothetical protein [Myoviridae sp. ctkfK18]
MRKMEQLKERFENIKNIKLKDQKELDQNKIDNVVTDLAIILEDTDFSVWSMHSIDEIKEYLYNKYSFIEIVELLNNRKGTSLKELLMGMYINECMDYDFAVKEITKALDIIEKAKYNYNNSISFANIPYLETWYKDIQEMFDRYEKFHQLEVYFRSTETYKKYFKKLLPNNINIPVEELREQLRSEFKKYQKGNSYYPIFRDNESYDKEYWAMLDCRRFRDPKWNANWLKVICDRIELIKDVNNFESLDAHDNMCAEINKLIQWGLVG